jgi:hypothetical protein
MLTKNKTVLDRIRDFSGAATAISRPCAIAFSGLSRRPSSLLKRLHGAGRCSKGRSWTGGRTTGPQRTSAVPLVAWCRPAGTEMFEAGRRSVLPVAGRKEATSSPSRQGQSMKDAYIQTETWS